MTRRMLVLAFPILVLSAFLTACDSTMEPSSPPAVQAVLNEPFWLVPGQTAVLADEHLSVTFAGVVDDTRCPIDIVCIVAGNATMSVRARRNGQAAMTLSLTLTDDPPAVGYDGFGIHAQQLMPAVRSDRTIRPGEYSVRLLVERP